MNFPSLNHKKSRAVWAKYRRAFFKECRTDYPVKVNTSLEHCVLKCMVCDEFIYYRPWIGGARMPQPARIAVFSCLHSQPSHVIAMCAWRVRARLLEFRMRDLLTGDPPQPLSWTESVRTAQTGNRLHFFPIPGGGGYIQRASDPELPDLNGWIAYTKSGCIQETWRGCLTPVLFPSKEAAIQAIRSAP